MTFTKSFVSENVPIFLLKLLSEKDMYGYEIMDAMSILSDNIFELKAGMFYPFLHSLVQSGYLTSYRKDTKGKKRRYYQITSKGKNYLTKTIEDWKKYINTVSNITGGDAYEC